jgi:hypothetical protein
MTRAGVLAVLLVSSAWAQLPKQVSFNSTGSTAPVKTLRIAPQTFRDLERRFDGMLVGMVPDPNDPVEIVGNTRGLHLEGYGVVFTAEISLVTTPGLSPFQPTIPKELAERVHNRRVERLPALKKMMQDMLHLMAMTFAPQIPPDQHLVLAIRLWYASWENSDGMPAQVVASATRADAQAGNIQMDVQ